MIAAVGTRGGAGTRRWFAPIAGMLTGTAWLALLLWEQSPYGRYLDHPRWTDAGLAAALCRALPAGDVVLPVLLYAGGWLLMIAAMMLPTALPLLRLFDRMVQPRRDYAALMALLIAGYLAAWAGFGIAAHLLDAALHAGVRQSDWLMLNGWAIGAAVLALAGLFQFSPLKYRCLDKCRAPFGFIAERWQGPRPWRSAWRLGLDHWALLRRLLLGIDAADVCCRHRQRRLDARARRDHGGREEHAVGPPSQPPARRHPRRRRRDHRGQQSLRLTNFRVL
jgi:predicted metal-binding membrane protein